MDGLKQYRLAMEPYGRDPKTPRRQQNTGLDLTITRPGGPTPRHHHGRRWPSSFRSRNGNLGQPDQQSRHRLAAVKSNA